MDLRKRWLSLPWGESVPISQIENKFEELKDAYSASSRGYHTLQHIEECLTEFDSIRRFIDARYSFEFALWYHDIVYDTALPATPGLNERLSANKLMKDLLALGVNGVIISKAAPLIFATQHSSNPIDWDAKFIVDVDLAIFGQTWDRVSRYESGIRKEYPILNRDPKARKVRADILGGFLRREFIYYTPHFRKKYETRARENLTLLIAGLKS